MKLETFLKFADQVQRPPPPELLLKKNFSVNFTVPFGKQMPDGRPSPINYGLIPGTKNPVDNRPWEIVVPGLQMALSGIRVDRIVGMVAEKSGDHTLVGIPVGMMDQKQFEEQLQKFIQIRRRYDTTARFVSS